MQKRLKQAIFAGTQATAQKDVPLTPIEKLQALQAQMPQAGYIRQAGLLKVLPISSATLWRWVNKEAFPKPVKLSPRITAWRVDEVQRWLEKSGLTTA
ncbi:AlpA family phage regulatory protein [Hydrogenophaga sp. YM1]|nr:AlpA family phage regulatory protein [Hydrogenophaga sp. YM1]